MNLNKKSGDFLDRLSPGDLPNETRGPDATLSEAIGSLLADSERGEICSDWLVKVG